MPVELPWIAGQGEDEADMEGRSPGERALPGVSQAAQGAGIEQASIAQAAGTSS